MSPLSYVTEMDKARRQDYLSAKRHALGADEAPELDPNQWFSEDMISAYVECIVQGLRRNYRCGNERMPCECDLFSQDHPWSDSGEDLGRLNILKEALSQRISEKFSLSLFSLELNPYDTPERSRTRHRVYANTYIHQN